MVQAVHATSGTEIDVRDAFLASVLEPYKPHCRYLLRVTVSGITERHVAQRSGAASQAPCTSREPGLLARGEFSIPESCYIASTGHFNAVEFNICYNQLVYTLLGTAVERQLLEPFAGWSMADYRRRQLSDFLIAEFSSAFRSPMRSDWFEGFAQIDRVAVRKGTIFMKTSVWFQDRQGGQARGGALIAIINGNHTAPGAVP